MAELEREQAAMLQRRKTKRGTIAATKAPVPVRQGTSSEAVGTGPVDEDTVSTPPTANGVKPDGAEPADEGLASAASIADSCANDAEPAGQASGVGSAAPADSDLAGAEPPAHVVEFASPENRSDGAGELDGTGAKELGLASESGGDVSGSADDDFAAVAQAQATFPPRHVRSVSQLADVVDVSVRYDDSGALYRSWRFAFRVHT